MFKMDEILELIKAIDHSTIQKIELEEDHARIVILKEGSVSAIAATTYTAETIERSDAKPQEKGNADVQDSLPKEDKCKFHTIAAPIVGTFYAAAEPGAEPFVKIGQKVKADTVVCVLEAMKLFNEIEAGVSGEIVEVLVKNDEFVEYGQPLFLVKPD